MAKYEEIIDDWVHESVLWSIITNWRLPSTFTVPCIALSSILAREKYRKIKWKHKHNTLVIRTRIHRHILFSILVGQILSFCNSIVCWTTNMDRNMRQTKWIQWTRFYACVCVCSSSNSHTVKRTRLRMEKVNLHLFFFRFSYTNFIPYVHTVTRSLSIEGDTVSYDNSIVKYANVCERVGVCVQRKSWCAGGIYKYSQCKIIYCFSFVTGRSWFVVAALRLIRRRRIQ